MSRRILITGARGFIGSALNRHLASMGYSTVGLDVRPAATPDPDVEVATGDFRDPELMKGLLPGVDVVFHLASAHLQVNVPESEYWDTNVHGLGDFLGLCRGSGVRRFVHFSSVGAYGPLAVCPADESTPCRPRSLYGRTKLAGEARVLEAGASLELEVSVVRPTWVFGPTCPRTLKIYRALKRGRFVMIGTGSNLRHPVYIEDLLEASRVVMDHDAAVGGVFLVGGERWLSSGALIDTMCEALELPRPRARVPVWVARGLAAGVEIAYAGLGREPPVSRRTLEFFTVDNAFDVSKARDVLGVRPRFTFREGLLDCREELMRRAH